MKQILKQLILPLKAIDTAFPPQGLIYDLGCGEGIASRYLAHLPTRQVIGIDLNHHKINQARQQTTGLKNISFSVGNIINSSLSTHCTGVLLADVLHHLSSSQQLELLSHLSHSLKRGGVLVIKEIDQRDRVRAKLSRLWDFIFYPHDKIHYLDSSSLISRLNRLGFRVLHQRVCPLIPGSIHLYIGTKL